MDTLGKSLYDVADLLKGPEQSQVTVRILRPGSNKPEDVVLARERVAIKAVTSGVCPSSPGIGGPESAVGYVRLQAFNTKTTEEFREALKALQAKGVSKLVIDLRNNTGGFFPSSVEIARLFLNKGDIVLVADSEGVRDIYSATGVAIETERPVTLLVNKGTASAAEVLTGALKDNRRATVAGETTFGKGLIQTIVDLSDGSGVAVTVAKYQTPSGTDINRVGIAPDISLREGDVPAGVDAFCSLAGTKNAPRLFQ